MSESCDRCRVIGGSEESVMGLKRSWTVEWREPSGKIRVEKVMAHDVQGAIDEWGRHAGRERGFIDQRFILGVCKD